MEIVRSERLYSGRVVALRIDEARLDDGRVVRWEVVEHGESVTVVPVRDDGSVVLVRQYRHPTGEMLLETVAGGVDPGEDPLAAAQRELAEEVGCSAREWRRLGEFYLAPGWATERMHVFLARGLASASAPADDDEAIARVEIPWAELHERIRRGEIRDAKSIAAIHLAEPYVRP